MSDYLNKMSDYINQNSAVVNLAIFENSLLLPCARMHSRVMRLVTSVCVHIYMCVYMWSKKQAV